MNILEQYIEEVHNVRPYTAEWTKKFDKEFVEVDITTNCYGSKKRDTHVFSTVEWEKVVEQGYYMA
jgi:hypothetical protein